VVIKMPFRWICRVAKVTSPDDTGLLEAELPTTVFSYAGREPQRKEHRLRDFQQWRLQWSILQFELLERL
jgi:hypothetical protein